MSRLVLLALIALVMAALISPTNIALAGGGSGGSCACSITCGGTFWSPLRCTAEGTCPCTCKCSGTSPVCGCAMNIKEEGGEG